MHTNRALFSKIRVLFFAKIGQFLYFQRRTGEKSSPVLLVACLNNLKYDKYVIEEKTERLVCIKTIIGNNDKLW